MSKNEKKTEKVILIPFSNGYLAENLKLALTPLLKLKNVAEKWSADIFYEKEYVIKCLDEYEDVENTEENLFRKVDEKSFINSLETINNITELLIGKLTLKNNTYMIEIDEVMLQLKKLLDEMYDVCYSLESFLYLDCNYEDYAKLYETLKEVQNNFSTIYKNYKKMKTELNNNKCLFDINVKQPLVPIYEKILQLSSKTFQLDDNTRLYDYKILLKDFSRNLANELFYVVGKSYMDIENWDEINSKARARIEKLFNDLEESSEKRKKRLGYVFHDIEATYTDCYYTKIDKELLYLYQELKAMTHTLIYSSWRY